jgi:hypothetical protein
MSGLLEKVKNMGKGKGREVMKSNSKWFIYKYIYKNFH